VGDTSSTTRQAERLERTRREFDRLATLGLDREHLFRRAAELLQTVVPFDGGCWHTLDPATRLITSHWTNLSGDGFAMIVESEYRHDDVAKFAQLAAQRVPASALTAETAGASMRFAAYRERGWRSELRAAFVVDGDPWGAVMLLRSADVRPFSESELRAVAMLGTPLGQAIRRAAATEAAVTPREGVGVVVVAGTNRVESLGGVDPGWADDPALLAVAEQARAGCGEPRARVRHADGWFVLHGTTLEDDPRRVAVIVEPARSGDVGPLLAAAHGLTRRERDVLREVVRGRSTKEIAAALRVTPYTVQDHLKSIFEKTGTSTRSELVARLFFLDFEPRLG
jgi:DNA-binding CsgD family transcriptional regulator